MKVATLEVEIGAKIDQFERSLGKVRKDLKGMEKRLGGVSRGATKATTAFSGMAKKLLAVGIAYFGARGIFRMAKSFLDVATSVETYKLRLEAMLGSQEAATEAMNYFKEVAAKVPFTLEAVIEAGVKVQAFGADLKAWTPIMADLAAYMGVTLPEAAGALGRAFAGGVGAADIFRERGILQVIKDFAKMEKGIDDITKISLPEFRNVMFEAFAGAESKVAGTADKLATTWVGIISMLQDKWFKFRDTVMKTKIFELMKEGLASFNESMDEFVKTGGLEEWAKDTAVAVIEAFKFILEAFKGIAVGFEAMKAALVAITTRFTEMLLDWSEFVLSINKVTKVLGGAFKKEYEDLIKRIEFLKGLNEGLNEQFDIQVDKIIAITEKYDPWIKKLREAKEEIEKSKKATEELGDKTEEFTDKVKTSIANLPPSIMPPAAIEMAKMSLKDLRDFWLQWVKDYEEGLEIAKQKTIDTFASMAQAIGNFFAQIGGLSQTHFNNQMIALDEQTQATKDAFNIRYEAEKEKIENSLMSEEEKAEALEKLEEEKIKAEEKRDKEYETKKRAIKKKAFESDKKILFVTAIMNIAAAIARALPDLALAIITAAAGAVQLATISAQTFPGFEKGGWIPKPMPVMAGHGPKGEIIAQPSLLAKIISQEMPRIGSPGMGFAPATIQPIVNIYAQTLNRDTVDRASEWIYDALEREGRRRG